MTNMDEMTNMAEQLWKSLSGGGLVEENKNVVGFRMNNSDINIVPEFQYGCNANGTHHALDKGSFMLDEGCLTNGISKEPYPIQQGNTSDGNPQKANEIDGRTKRKIKNRESAERSRARKEAYLKQLELDVEDLREENAKLKKKLKVLSEEIVSLQPVQKAKSY